MFLSTSLKCIKPCDACALSITPFLSLYAAYLPQMLDLLLVKDDLVDVRFWSELVNEHLQGGVHNPRAEVLFPAFCEALVRIAAVR